MYKLMHSVRAYKIIIYKKNLLGFFDCSWCDATRLNCVIYSLRSCTILAIYKH